jgi:hypothetical protein
MSAFINRIGTAVPAHDIHVAFIAFARTMLTDDKTRTVFDRMAERSGIAHRHSHMRPGDFASGEVDAGGFYQRGNFPVRARACATMGPTRWIWRWHPWQGSISAVSCRQLPTSLWRRAAASAHPASISS